MNISRSDARIKGLSLFFTGRPCARGHVESRRVSNGNCISCEKAQHKEYYKKNSERVLKRRKEYAKENPEKRASDIARWRKNGSYNPAERCRERYATDDAYRQKVLQANMDFRNANKSRLKRRRELLAVFAPDILSGYDKRKYQKNKEKISERAKKYYLENKEAIAARKARWVSENQEKVRAGRWRRKARIKSAEGAFTGEDISSLYEKQKGRCASCREDLHGKYDVDHIHPLLLGGSNYPENLQLLCPSCNRAKSYKDPLKWANERGMLL